MSYSFPNSPTLNQEVTTSGVTYRWDGAAWVRLGSSTAVTSSGLVMTTGRLLGRTTASTGSIEEITPNGNFTLSGGSLSPAFRGVVLGRATQGASVFANNSLTNCPWDLEVVDTDNWFDAGTSTTNVVLNATYNALRVSLTVFLDSNWGASGDIRLNVGWYASDGSTFKGYLQNSINGGSASAAWTVSGTFYGPTASGDIIRAAVLQQSGSARIYNNSPLALSRLIVEIAA